MSGHQVDIHIRTIAPVRKRSFFQPMTRRLFLLSGSVLFPSILLGVPKFARAGEKTLTVAVPYDISTLDPADGRGTTEKLVMKLIHLNLEEDSKGYEAAEWIDGDDDDDSIKFKLLEDLEWTDGSRLTAHDFKFSLDRFKSLDPKAANRSFWQFVDEVKVDGDFAGKIKLKGSDAGSTREAVRSRAGGIVSEDVTSNRFTTNPPSSAARYELTEHKPAESITLRKNRAWKRSKPKYDKIFFQIFPDSKNRETMIATAKADVADADEATAQRVVAGQIPSVQLATSPSRRFTWLALNHGLRPFDSPQARDALRYGLRVDEIVGVERKILIERARSIFLPSAPFGQPAIEVIEPDSSTARQLISDAGYLRTNVDVMIEEGALDDRGIDVLSKSLSDIGLIPKIQRFPPEEFWSVIRKRTGQILISWALSPVHPLTNEFWFSSGESSLRGWQSWDGSLVDEALVQLRQQGNLEGAVPIARSAEKILQIDGGLMFLGRILHGWAYREGLEPPVFDSRDGLPIIDSF